MISYFKERIFSKIAFLFLVATLALILSSYYVLNWEFVDKDSILDAHDAYLQYKLVASWDFPDNQDSMALELDNLNLFCTVYIDDGDEICENDSLVTTAFLSPYESCDYDSWQDTKQINLDLAEEKKAPLNFDGAYVSFGQVLGPENAFFEAAVVEWEGFRYLLVLKGYSPPNELLAFVPSVILASLFMLALYLLIRRFLYPISLIQNRMLALEGGDLDSVIVVNGNDELAQLSKKFNNLVSEIKALLDQKESLLSEVSHELRTPLAKIKLLLELEYNNKNKEKINNQIEHLDLLITNILIADKMSAPYSELDIDQISIKELVQRSIWFAKKIDFILDLQTNQIISVDIVKMSVAIKNLLDNAHKYAKSNRPIIIKGALAEEFVYISITDFGPGIPEKLLTTIMDPFVQGNQQNRGFGLGLAIAKKVLSAHGGKLFVQNNKSGCTFTLNIPIKKENINE